MSVMLQYLFAAVALTALALLAVLPRVRRREPRRVLLALSALNVLRFGGVAGALAALDGSRTPSFLVQIAIGDGSTALAAVLALLLLARRSQHAAPAVFVMNALGLLGILSSETWLQCLEATGRVTVSSALHGPSIGAALFTALHALAFCVLARYGSTPQSTESGSARQRALG